MKIHLHLLLLLIFGSSLGLAAEVGTVMEVFPVDGYDDNDIVQMAATVAPPAHSKLRFERVNVEIDTIRNEILLTPLYRPVKEVEAGIDSTTVVFPLGKLKAATYDVIAGGARMDRLRIARAYTQNNDDYFYPEIQNFEVTKSKDRGRLIVSITGKVNPTARVHDVRVIVDQKAVVLLLIMQFGEGGDESAPAVQRPFTVTLPNELPKGKVAFLVKGKVVTVDNQEKTSDVLKVVDLDQF